MYHSTIDSTLVLPGKPDARLYAEGCMRMDIKEGCVYSTGTGTGNFALGVPVTSPPKNLEIF